MKYIIPLASVVASLYNKIKYLDLVLQCLRAQIHITIIILLLVPTITK